MLNTNRKRHKGLQLVPKSMTLDDLERPLRAMLHDTYPGLSVQNYGAI